MPPGECVDDLDTRFRLSAFEYLSRLTFGEPDVPVRWIDLKAFEFEGQVFPLIGARGIWKPRILEMPISIATAPPKPGRPAPYDDEIRDDDTIVYRYRGDDPAAHDNVGLRQTMWRKKPLIYFHGIEKGLYLAAWPVHVVGDHPEDLAVTVDLSPTAALGEGVAEAAPVHLERRYAFVPARRRLHQAKFRTRVMAAYRRRCAICRLGHESLLDAAHIIPDREAAGVASIRNGLSLCKIHHAAFDGNILGIDPDLVVHVREDILEEVDGPMLQHGIKEMHGTSLSVVPRKKDEQPSRDFLSERFRRFKQA